MTHPDELRPPPPSAKISRRASTWRQREPDLGQARPRSRRSPFSPRRRDTSLLSHLPTTGTPCVPVHGSVPRLRHRSRHALCPSPRSGGRPWYADPRYGRPNPPVEDRRALVFGRRSSRIAGRHRDTLRPQGPPRSLHSRSSPRPHRHHRHRARVHPSARPLAVRQEPFAGREPCFWKKSPLMNSVRHAWKYLARRLRRQHRPTNRIVSRSEPRGVHAKPPVRRRPRRSSVNRPHLRAAPPHHPRTRHRLCRTALSPAQRSAETCRRPS